MADDDWKKRIGIEINFSSDEEASDHESGNFDETDDRYRGSVDYTNNSIEGGIDGYAFDEIFNKYDDYGHTPPRTRISNKEKLRKWRDKDDIGENKAATKTVYAKKLSNSRPLASFKPYINLDSVNPSINRSENDYQKMDLDRRKRCLKLLRESQRDFKLDLVNLPASNVCFVEQSDDRAESLPVIKVETSNRFMSLTSKLVATNQIDRGQSANELHVDSPKTGSENLLPVGNTTSNDRVSFHRTFSHLLRFGNSEVIDKTSRRQLSREEHLWQSELKDLIWLELQAWHAERTPTEQDQFVCQERTKIGGLLDEIMNYRFVRKSGLEKNNQCSFLLAKGNDFNGHRGEWSTKEALLEEGSRENTLTSDEILTKEHHKVNSMNSIGNEPCEEPKSLCCKEDDRGGGKIVEDDKFFVKHSNVHEKNNGYEVMGECCAEIKHLNGSTQNMNDIEDCPGCYSMYCKVCLDHQNAAMGEVESFLHRLGYAESLYPSSKAFAADYPLYHSQEFIMRIKAMCLWYNMTRHHLLKIIILGKLLLQFKNKKQNWPLEYRDGSTTPNDLESSPWTSTSSSHSSTMPHHDTASCGISASSSSSGLESGTFTSSSQTNTETDDDFDREPCEMMKAIYDSEVRGSKEVGYRERRVSRVTFALDCFESSPSESNGSEISSHSMGSRNGNGVHAESGAEISSQLIYSASMSVLNDDSITKARKENGLDGSPYQVYIERMLKTKGLRKALHFIEKLHRYLLCKSRISLQRPRNDNSIPKCPILEGRVPPVVDGISAISEQEEKELQRHGYWSSEAQDIGLPSYCSAFLFICRVPLDVIHAYLQIRCEQKPKAPSDLSIRQLMREFKEGLQIAVLQRQRYLHHIRTALWNAKPEIRRSFEDGVTDFDQSTKKVLETYLEYLKQWVLMVQQESLLISTYQKNLLEEEWAFVKATCPHIPGGEALAANTFCLMAKDMLTTIGKYLNAEIDDLIQNMDEYGSGEDSAKHIVLAACRSLHSIFTEARERALKGLSFAKTLRKDLEIAASFSLNASPQNFLKRLHQTGHVRVIAPHSCKHLMFIPGSIRHCSEQIRKLVNMNCSAGECWSNVNSAIDRSGTVGLASMAQETSSPVNTSAPTPMPATGSGVYLLLVQGDNESKSSEEEWNWEGDTVNMQSTTETTISLSQIEVEGVLLVACDPSQLATHRRLFLDTMEDVIKIVRENRPSNNHIAESLMKLKGEALQLRDCITHIISLVEEKCTLENIMVLDESERLSIILRSREILQQCYKFGFEYHKELSRLVTGEARAKLSRGMIAFAQQWMNFVQSRCERGRGLRPRWAQQGLEFLSTICDPRHTQCISDKEFQDLKSDIEKCIAHVIGNPLERSPSSSNSLAPSQQTSLIPSPVSSRPTSPHPIRRIYSATEARSGAVSPSAGGPKTYRSSRSMQEMVHSEQSVSPGNTRRRGTFPHVNGNASVSETLIVPNKVLLQDHSLPASSPLTRIERVREAVSKLDHQLEESLKEGELIGRVAPEAQRSSSDHIHIRSRSVTFSWQRGIKLGQGRFGKVYTAVNNRTGELMAMKEIQLHPNDHRTIIRSVAEELRIFEGIHHRHLVRYYGVEIHREEMLLFMEYCAEGTLENLVAATEEAAAMGLPEPIIRRYTYQLLQAVATLHHHGIVHRDIKSANIFLTDEGNCLKLGDFGSAVKIKTHTTLPGELQGFVGTQAYMAPEVFMKTTHEGHGRAADIWSVGCVVVEMASGKRPWHEFDSNYQIMFKVGMGETPAWPSTLSSEGQDFLERCLQHDPRKRETAVFLLQHTFVKVEVDEEYQSLPLPSILEEYLKDNLKK